MPLPIASLSEIRGYHAHVYFDQATLERARVLCEAAAKEFPLKMGRVHERKVGPHPDWSCQLAFLPEQFANLVPWLAMNRGGLVVFVHPISNNEILDHTARAMWMGDIRPLDLSVLADGPGDTDL
ncbi:MAG: dioxygenase [Burkholderiales bacterium PBB4]|nr:MAG: dioxygenase [Burkholderiales bacterium PBB4]